MSGPLNLEYPEVLENFGNHLVKGRTDSRAFLAWFLEHYYRLDETEAQDAVCDGPDDKGIDGIYVNSGLDRIEVFQAKLLQNVDRTVGDNALKSFAGSLDQLSSAESVRRLAAGTSNSELRNLLTSLEVDRLIESGYGVRGVFISNAREDASAQAYRGHRDDIVVHDGDYLQENWLPPGESSPVHSSIQFRLDGHELIHYLTPEAEVFVAPLLGTELVKMGGLESQELFAWNVRQALGRTKVNRAIAESVNQPEEHKNFLLYHNGLTILAESAEKGDDVITIDGYTVVNGCQSLSTLFDNRNSISDELMILTRIIKLAPQSDLASKITRHSNNQNAITARDLQSNSAIQRRLQMEFKERFGSRIGYEIKRGEGIDAERVITNESAGRLLLAFDLEQPWSCHQSYKLFDELHSEIFGRPDVNAHRIAMLALLESAVSKALDGFRDQLVARYTLTKYFLIYLVKQALLRNDIGKTLIREPQKFWDLNGETAIEEAFSELLVELLVDVDAELREREEGGRPFDHKRELKSPNSVRSLASEIMRSYEKMVARGRTPAFGQGLSDGGTN